MDLDKKIKGLIWILPVAAIAVTMCETAVVRVPETSGVSVSEDVALNPSKDQSGAADDAPFSPAIKSASDALRYFSVRETSNGYIYYRPPVAVGLRSLLDDYQFPLAQRLSFIARSRCGLREVRYVGAAPGARGDDVAVRIFWTCDDVCLTVVSETSRHRDVGRYLEIPLARAVCVDTWAGRGIPLAGADTVGDP